MAPKEQLITAPLPTSVRSTSSLKSSYQALAWVISTLSNPIPLAYSVSLTHSWGPMWPLHSTTLFSLQIRTISFTSGFSSPDSSVTVSRWQSYPKLDPLT